MSGSVSAYSMPARLNGEFSERNGSPREAGTLDAIEREIDDEVRMRCPGGMVRPARTAAIRR
jgi:hypothetical protein